MVELGVGSACNLKPELNGFDWGIGEKKKMGGTNGFSLIGSLIYSFLLKIKALIN